MQELTTISQSLSQWKKRWRVCGFTQRRHTPDKPRKLAAGEEGTILQDLPSLLGGPSQNSGQGLLPCEDSQPLWCSSRLKALSHKVQNVVKIKSGDFPKGGNGDEFVALMSRLIVTGAGNRPDVHPHFGAGRHHIGGDTSVELGCGHDGVSQQRVAALQAQPYFLFNS